MVERLFKSARRDLKPMTAAPDPVSEVVTPAPAPAPAPVAEPTPAAEVDALVPDLSPAVDDIDMAIGAFQRARGETRAARVAAVEANGLVVQASASIVPLQEDAKTADSQVDAAVTVEADARNTLYVLLTPGN